MRPVTPLFAAADASPSEILATYPDGSAAVALRQSHGGQSLFVGAPGLTSELLRLAARKAGVHLYTQTDCNVYANGPIVALHASQDGPITLDTGRRGPVHDALTGDLVGNGPSSGAADEERRNPRVPLLAVTERQSARLSVTRT